MTLEEITKEWIQDSYIDRDELGTAAIESSKLHAKYLQIFYKERLILANHQQKFAKLKKLRTEYWSGDLSSKEIQDLDWEIQPKRVLKQDIAMYLESDDLIQAASMKIIIQEEKIKVVDSIIKNIQGRGYNISSAIQYEKWKSGS